MFLDLRDERYSQIEEEKSFHLWGIIFGMEGDEWGGGREEVGFGYTL
ncbi:hypothetical protein [uncultured Helicobacter sp.]|nr:hypothetical protein [uncultured Helicobacter sp.]